MTRTYKRPVLRLAIRSVVAVACSPGDKAVNAASSASASTATVSLADLTGAGATFASPLYSKWISEHASVAMVRVAYQSVGSGEGVRQLSEQAVDFGGTDGPMTDDELTKAR